jgi:hypothetical protein
MVAAFGTNFALIMESSRVRSLVIVRQELAPLPPRFRMIASRQSADRALVDNREQSVQRLQWDRSRMAPEGDLDGFVFWQ